MLHNKRAVVSETLTWVVATVIIIVILVFSIFITSLLAEGKNLIKDNKDKKFEFENKKDLLAAKSVSGYLLTTDDFGEKVFEQIVEEGDLNDFNGPIGVSIFKNYETEKYQEIKHLEDEDGSLKGVWLRLQADPVSVKWPTRFPLSIQENYFPEGPSSGAREEFWLGENKYAVFYFG